MKDDVLVSVIMITYQHAEFIQQDIQSVLDQKTVFKYELLLGEDMSTDGTREICQKMAKDHPEKIRLFLHDRSDLISIMGKPSGRRNFIELLKNARGKYIALCPGDDMWTDSSKIQKLVEVLENEPEAAICFHNAVDQRSDGSEIDYVRTWLKKDDLPSTFQLEDIVVANFIPSSGCIFRRSNFDGIPKAFLSVPALDWYMHVLGAMKGSIRYIDKIMSVRRIHERGIVSMKPRLTKIDWNLEMLDIIDHLTERGFHQRIDMRKTELLRTALDITLHSNPQQARSVLRQIKGLDGKVLSTTEELKAFLIIYMPWISGSLYRIRSFFEPKTN